MFLTEMDLAADPAPDMWVYRQPLIWCDPVFGRIEAPIGFRTDLASIPRLFRNLPAFDPNGLSRLPAGLHDWLYRLQRDKAKADQFLYAALQQQGMSQIDAYLYYDAVHVFGGPSWASDSAGVALSCFDTAANYMAYCKSIPV